MKDHEDKLRAAEACWLLLLCSAILPMISGCSYETPQSDMPLSHGMFTPPPQDIAQAENLPPIGKWMYGPDMRLAHWLGQTYKGKQLHEPINVILIDPLAASAEDAKERLIAKLVKAGYLVRRGHSCGYHGFIANQFYDELPDQKDHAFSNEPFEVNNNHGRAFGPARTSGGYLFIASFSRERCNPLRKVMHEYVSFNRARDDLAQKLAERSDCKITRPVDLDNDMIDVSDASTGDHDGIAAVLVATK